MNCTFGVGALQTSDAPSLSDSGACLANGKGAGPAAAAGDWATAAAGRWATAVALLSGAGTGRGCSAAGADVLVGTSSTEAEGCTSDRACSSKKSYEVPMVCWTTNGKLWLQCASTQASAHDQVN